MVYFCKQGEGPPDLGDVFHGFGLKICRQTTLGNLVHCTEKIRNKNIIYTRNIIRVFVRQGLCYENYKLLKIDCSYSIWLHTGMNVQMVLQFVFSGE